MPAKKKAQYHCAVCGRVLRDGNWIYSRATGKRYCTEKQGHKRPLSVRRQQQLRDSWPSLARQTDALVERLADAA